MIADYEEFNKDMQNVGEFFEQIIAEIGRVLVKKGDHVVDVGANYGIHTITLARKVGWTGRVTAIEAIPSLAARLRRLTRWSPQVRIVCKAMSFKEGMTQFKRVVSDEGWSGIRQKQLPKEMKSSIETIMVPMTCLDCISIGKRPLTFIKIDVEGGEFDVIKGAINTIKKYSPFIVFENNGISDAELYDYTEDDFFELFESISYEVFDLFGRKLTRQLWGDYIRPWYVIAVPKCGEGADFVRQKLRPLIHRLGTRK